MGGNSKYKRKELTKCIDQEYIKSFGNFSDFGVFCQKNRNCQRRIDIWYDKAHICFGQNYIWLKKGISRPYLTWKTMIASAYAFTKEQQKELNRCIDLARAQ